MKWIGACLIVVACGGCGWKMVADYRQEERYLRQLCKILEWIGCELSSRMWPLPVLFRQIGQQEKGILQNILLELAQEMEKVTQPDANGCMISVLQRHPSIPESCKSILLDLGSSLGRFDLQGQLREILRIQTEANGILESHCANRDERLRCYRTLSLCAGSILAILLL